jgi:hypothetical protein
VAVLPFDKPLNPTSPPYFKGGKMESFIKSISKGTPPFEKGRLGGIFGNAF